MGVELKVTGVDELRRKLEETVRKVVAGVERAVADEVEDLADDMRSNARVGDESRGRRGDPPLGESIVTDVAGVSGSAGPTAKHAWVFEHGTRSRPAEPLVGPAAERGRARFPDRVVDEVLKELT